VNGGAPARELTRWYLSRMRRVALAVVCSGAAACTLISGASDLVVAGAPPGASTADGGGIGGGDGQADGTTSMPDATQDTGGGPPGGTVDATFGTAGRSLIGFGGSDQGRGLTLGPAGTIVVAGRTTGASSIQTDFAAARLTSNGALDATFGLGGTVTIDFDADYDEATGIALRSDGYFLLTGRAWNATKGGFVIATTRLQPSGLVDLPFGTQGREEYGAANANNQDGTFALVLAPGDAPIVAGSQGGNVAIASLTADGAGSSVVVGGSGVVRGLARQTDGKLVVVGYTPAYSSASASTVLVERRLSSLQLDSTFGVGGRVVVMVGLLDHAAGVAIASDGKIVVAGDTKSSPNADEDVFLLRFDANGSLDPTFGKAGRVVTALGTASVDKGRAVAIDASGRVLVTGSTTKGNDQDLLLLRYDAAGALDTSFGDNGVVAPATVGIEEGRDIKLAPDGRIVVAGTGSNGTDADFLVMRFWP
jgi:uncharacterized delta-60 repeat protein